jgi:hypothetical protein
MATLSGANDRTALGKNDPKATITSADSVEKLPLQAGLRWFE